jgi:hypothetical protein
MLLLHKSELVGSVSGSNRASSTKRAMGVDLGYADFGSCLFYAC